MYEVRINYIYINNANTHTQVWMYCIYSICTHVCVRVLKEKDAAVGRGVQVEIEDT